MAVVQKITKAPTAVQTVQKVNELVQSNFDQELALTTKLDKTGGSITGDLTISGNLMAAGQVAFTQPVDADITGIAATATQAIQDDRGNVIRAYYQPKLTPLTNDDIETIMAR